MAGTVISLKGWEGVNYRFFCCARAQFPCAVTISVDSASGSTYIAKELEISSAEWSEYELNMTAPADDFTVVLAITSREICKFYLNFVSFFPENTFKGRKNGMREDIAQMLADSKPRFMRFPGGCLVHDGTLNAQKLFMNNTGTALLRTVKTGLDKVVVLGGDKIAGAVFIETDQCSLSVSEITITDISDGTVAALEAFSLRPAEKKYLADIDSEHYKIEFKAKKHFGEKGFRLLFGSKDDKTVIRWLVGGWANQDTEINALVDGRGTSLDHNMFSLASGCEYHFCMEVNGIQIITYINGTAVNKAVDRLPEIEELYFTASRDEDHIYVKCVNVREETVTAQLCIEGTDRLYGSVYTMTGEDKDENSFENPKKVIPLERELCYGNNCIEYTFPGKSITVFCVRRVWERD